MEYNNCLSIQDNANIHHPFINNKINKKTKVLVKFAYLLILRT